MLFIASKVWGDNMKEEQIQDYLLSVKVQQKLREPETKA